MKTTIKYSDQSVDCYGKLDEWSNIAIEGDCIDGSELSTFDTTGGYASWTEAVHAIVEYFPEGTKIYEISAV